MALYEARLQDRMIVVPKKAGDPDRAVSWHEEEYMRLKVEDLPNLAVEIADEFLPGIWMHYNGRSGEKRIHGLLRLEARTVKQEAWHLDQKDDRS